MAEPESSDRPTLVAVERRASDDAGPPKPAARPAPKQERPRYAVWALGALLAFLAVTALVQTQRLGEAHGQVTSLSAEVQGLQADLTAANRQIRAFESQQAQVREAVSDLSERLLVLSTLVGATQPREPQAEPSQQP